MKMNKQEIIKKFDLMMYGNRSCLMGEQYKKMKPIYQLTFYKQAETGSFSIQTTPRFAGIDENRLTTWNASWNYRIDNPISNGVRPYQLHLT